MTDKELRRLKRVDLLELLIAQIRENERLKEALTDAQSRLEERELTLSRVGSIAEAALQLNSVFQSAQSAADQYVASVRALGEQKQKAWEQLERQVQAQADQYLQQALARCREMEEETRRRCEALADEAEKGRQAP